MHGPFEKMFDINRDGNLDVAEEAMMFDFLSRSSLEDDDDDDDDDIDDLELAGLDPDELEMMDPDERREALEEAGLDPDEYEDDF